MMKRDFRLRKYVILGALAALLAADAAFAVYSFRMTSSTVSPQQALAAQMVQLKLLRADVKRAREIQKAIPETKADCVRFENSLPPSSSGYSGISTDLEEVSHKAGLQIATLSFHSKEIAGRGMTELSMDASVNGNYQSVVRFLNGLQRSEIHYVVDDLKLASERSGPQSLGEIRVDLHLRSYFKAVA
jgi:hypothetical protein